MARSTIGTSQQFKVGLSPKALADSRVPELVIQRVNHRR